MSALEPMSTSKYRPPAWGWSVLKRVPRLLSRAFAGASTPLDLPLVLATQADRSRAWPATDAEQSGSAVDADADVLDPAVAGAAEAAGVTMAANIAIVATDRVVDTNIGRIFLHHYPPQEARPGR